ncbi:MAG: D-alanine--D-alanine ligase family protein [Lachnospiraceae bacterium]|nr:D-alanine--D-alanine ligase family protein [Lachnospiraceae bacterium]
MKKNLLVLFGGQSSEHDVSCMSVQNVVRCIDDSKYEIILVGITKEGHWVKCESLEDIASGEWRRGTVSAIVSPDATEKAVYFSDGNSIKIDVAFPVLHGNYGEDGTVQGLFELAGIPYVGCGGLSSAVTMDKYYTKLIVNAIGTIRQADYELVLSRKLDRKMDEYMDIIEKRFGYPVFVKPSVGGSSCGVSRANNREELEAGLKEAAKYDRKILVEEMIFGREIECAVLGGGDDIKASGVGEILAAAEFYDYDAKYNNPQSQTVIDPDIPAAAVEEIRGDAVNIFKSVDGHGLSRVDFFVKDDGTVIFNEINTIPGFTAISMYPMLWEAQGISKKDLVQRLIDLAYERV